MSLYICYTLHPAVSRCPCLSVWFNQFEFSASANLLVGMVTGVRNLFCESGGQHCTSVSTFLLLCDCSL